MERAEHGEEEQAGRRAPRRGRRRARRAGVTRRLIGVALVAGLVSSACSGPADDTAEEGPSEGTRPGSSGPASEGPATVGARPGVPRAAGDPDMADGPAATLQAALEEAFGAMEADGVPALGLADPEAGRSYTANTHFRIGSITKSVVGTALLRLVDEGRVELDQPISTWFPTEATGDPVEVVVPDGDRITLRQLAGMTSGIDSYTEDQEHGVEAVARSAPQTTWSPVELARLGTALPRSFEPGTQFQYSNTNTVLIGLVLEQVTGHPLPRVLDRLVLDPLGLDATSFPDTPLLPEPFARGFSDHTPDGSFADATHWDPSLSWAAGQVVSDLDDMATFAHQLGRGGLLEPGTFAERLEPSTPAGVAPELPGLGRYALAIMDSDGWLGHGGAIAGSLSYAGYHPDLDVAMAFNLNWGDTGAGAISTVRQHLARAIATIDR